MTDLSTKYMGLTLPSPVIAGACKLTDSVDGVRDCAAAGAGAVVLKSIFEEQIQAEAAQQQAAADDGAWHTEAYDYIQQYSSESSVERYLDLIRDAKREVRIPVIASIHCVSAGRWLEFAGRIERAGADALELNAFVLPSDLGREPRDLEQVYFDIATEVTRHVEIPVALKLGDYFTSMARTISQLSHTAVDGLVLFNRFYQPDIDIERKRLVPASFLSHPHEIALPLRWIAILAGHTGADLCASTGIDDGAGVVKQLLVGASAVQVVSTLYRNGVAHIGAINDELRAWMERHGHATIDEFRGALSRDRHDDPLAFERVQFMKAVAGIE